jgi:hypothetical protein
MNLILEDLLSIDSVHTQDNDKNVSLASSEYKAIQKAADIVHEVL